MCWIFAYHWRKNASAEIVSGLQKLEYRGYDSAGICVLDENQHAKLIRSTGKVMELKNLVESFRLNEYHTGIGHTRWATHGKVTESNCHPHVSQDGRFYVVHNGIIENYKELKNMLELRGYKFYGETDTEVVAKLFEYLFNGDILATLKLLIKRIDGAYALVFLDRENPNILFGAKRGSPLVLGINKDSVYISSDYRSLTGFSEHYLTLEDGDIFTVDGAKYHIENNEIPVVRELERMSEEERMMELWDFPHFMLKEIFEQPQVLENVFAGRVDFKSKTIRNNALEEVESMGFSRITIVASGTSYHSGLLGKRYFEELSDIPTDVIVAAEFKYQKKFIDKDTLFVFISQSGETADTLESLKIVNEKGGYTFGIVNVPGSSIARLSQSGLFTHAGVEVGVASTKAFLAQATTLLIMALYFGNKRNLDYIKYREILEELESISEKISLVFADIANIQRVAEKYSEYKNFFYLGRWYELPIAMEWSLKLKELTYHHSEAYSSGELKHGSLALIDENFPSIIINGNGPLHAKNLSSVEEVKSRGGKVVGLIAKNDTKKDVYDDVLEFHPSIPELNPLLEAVVLQLFAYFTADHLGRDIDKPRNLAKSVTVE